MQLFFLLSGSLGTVLVFAVLVVSLWFMTYCFSKIPPKMRCYEGDSLKRKMYVPKDEKFFDLMMKMKDDDKFEILIDREEVSYWGSKLFLMLISDDEATRKRVKDTYSFDCLVLQKRLFRITHVGTGKRWVVQLDDSDLYRVKYTLCCCDQL